MNTKGDANRSVQHTKRQLRAALVALLGQKPLREITVQAVAAKAGVSRGAFYFHYADIGALMADIEGQHLRQLEQLMDDLMPGISQNKMPPALPALFGYLNENSDICRALYGPHADPAFTARVKELLARRCLGLMLPAGATRRQQYLMEFAVGGCFGIIQAWQAAGHDLAPAAAADVTWQAIRAVRRQF